ncbi:protocadherin-1-like [Eriocheir sinensis]|uniref:protocadherin-1-like n=1 Tax=Eriocheir sinensis TaxID=95602 RepID=UPI0021C8164C|nr:protocadherin-1-like [Eriocheir sinensis]
MRGEADPSTFTLSLSFQGLVGVRPLRLQTRDTMQLLTPQTQQLRERIGEKLLQGRIVLALEGGFNLTTISYCMTLCAKALLGDLLPPLEPQLVPNKSAVQTTNGVIRTHSRYWLALCFKCYDNAHRPVFPGCQSYDDIHVTENVTAGSPVLLRLDRDGEDKEFFLTVIAKDSGLQPRQTSCSFRVVVEDVNDNPPVFDLPRYEQTLATDHNPATPVLRVSASDRDTGENARINYHLEGHPNHLEFFYLEPLTGVLTLKRPLQPTMVSTARAADEEGGGR